ncbi:zinc-binding dehydrogenase [Nostoc sp. JL23]|uniref:zinc-binding dehydrogenase n=1 Tax=Nostoc sp. JL23 TaxID=2815394 RepID=UPI0025E60209|nr:zinc-binding dehydrogenase [Nostoc sp. JL23]
MDIKRSGSQPSAKGQAEYFTGTVRVDLLFEAHHPARTSDARLKCETGSRTAPNKKEDALRLGADEVVVSRNADEMQKHTGSFDFILDTISANHDINAYLNLLTRDGNITLVGAPTKPLDVSAFSLIMARRSLSGSNIGGIAQTQEMLDFCGEHNITADVEVIPIQKVNEAYERLLKSDVKYRFCIDMASLKSA